MKNSLFCRSFVTALAALLAVFLTVSLLTTTLHAQNLPTLGDTGREDLPPSMERKIGEEIMLGVRDDKDYLDDEVSSEYLNEFGSKLLEVHQEARGESNFDFYFFAVRDPVINAFALPGGFIGVHSQLILTAQNESQLASVLAHEIGHVTQRHIARMLGKQKEDMIIPIASLILAALTMHASPDAAMALAVGGQGLSAQRQLNFSQSAEREADRVGLQIMRDGGFDPKDMVAFFERMQNSSRGYSDNFPAFLRTHPMTSERIADIGSRIRSQQFKTHVDNPDFALFQSRIRVLQDDSAQGLLDTKDYLKEQIKKSKKTNAADDYGLAFAAFKQTNYKEAQAYLNKARKEAGTNSANLFFSSLQLDILQNSNQNKEALKQAEIAIQAFPTSRGVMRQYTDALIANDRGKKAITYLRDQTMLYRKDFFLQRLLAKAYASEGQEALEHMALAEFYALSGAISPEIGRAHV